MSTMQHSLIVRLPNWVGDVIMSLPTLQALQDRGVHLHLLGKPWIKDLLDPLGLPVTTLNKSFWQARKQLSALEIEKVLLLTNSLSSAAMAALASKKPIGYKEDGRSVLLEAGLRKRSGLHEVEYFWELGRLACEYWFSEFEWPQDIPTQITLPLSDTAQAKAQEALSNANIHKPYWVICPFAHGKGSKDQSKIWPHWRELSMLLKDHNLVVCPGPGEEDLAVELAPGARALKGLNLADYAAVLAGAEQVVANDSGPMHLASAVGVKTLGIFGVTCPNRTFPWGKDHIGNQGLWPTLNEVLARLSLK